MGNPSQKSRNYWAAFLAKHEAAVCATGLPRVAFRGEDRLRRLLLYEGTVSTLDEGEAALESLDSTQWTALEKFCRVFFHEFESRDPLEQFLAFKRELQRRESEFRA